MNRTASSGNDKLFWNGAVATGVVSLEEGLAFIKGNNLFTGAWEENKSKRRLRVAQILSFIAKTFNPSLCVGVRHEIIFGKFDSWSKKHCTDGWQSPTKKWLDE
jgi:hypothetical protein